jgi:curved DNA-binding protein CbpA
MSALETLLTSLSALSPNFFTCLRLPVHPVPPSTVRKSYLTIARQVHPDKLNDSRAKAGFQVLSDAFECLYDEATQAEYIASLASLEASETSGLEATSTSTSSSSSGSSSSSKRKQGTGYDWKAAKKRKQKGKEREWGSQSWADVEALLNRLEEAERAFVKTKSAARLEAKMKGLLTKCQRICRTLDLRAGCPSTFTNSLWWSLAESDLLRDSPLPSGWLKKWDPKAEVVFFRETETGVTQFEHPDEVVEGKRVGMRKKEEENEARVDDVRGCVCEILEYMKDEYDYVDLHADLEELDDEIKDAEGGESRGKEGKDDYDF